MSARKVKYFCSSMLLYTTFIKKSTILGKDYEKNIKKYPFGFIRISYYCVFRLLFVYLWQGLIYEKVLGKG